MIDHLGIVDPSRPVNLQHPINRGVVAWWKNVPDFRRGNTVRDLCRHNGANDGTWSTNGDSIGTKWVGRAGGFGAWKFDGVDDYVDAGAGPTFDKLTGAVSCFVWIKLRELASVLGHWVGICTLRTVPAGQHAEFDFAVSPANDKLYYWHRDAAVWQSVNGTTSIAKDTPYYVGFTRDAAYNVDMYVDGVGEASAALNEPIHNGAAPFRFGQDAAANQEFDGTMDDLRIYDRQLSATEASQLLQLSRLRYSPLLNWITPPSDVAAATGGPWPHHMDNYDLSANFSGLGL